LEHYLQGTAGSRVRLEAAARLHPGACSASLPLIVEPVAQSQSIGETDNGGWLAGHVTSSALRTRTGVFLDVFGLAGQVNCGRPGTTYCCFRQIPWGEFTIASAILL
jgi:hypothetical protein